MKTIVPLATALALGLSTLSAVAGVNKTWVSGTGVDSGTCTFAAPCATFNYAIGQTNPTGEVDVKDSGGYGTFTIGKALSIEVPDGVLASINVPGGGNGVTVSASASDTIVIRGLTINGHEREGSSNGIIVNGARSIAIDHCFIRNLHEGLFYNNTEIVAIAINNQITGNDIGIEAAAQAYLVLSGNVVTGNITGVSANPNVFSYGDNAINGNFQTDVTGSITAAQKR